METINTHLINHFSNTNHVNWLCKLYYFRDLKRQQKLRLPSFLKFLFFSSLQFRTNTRYLWRFLWTLATLEKTTFTHSSTQKFCFCVVVFIYFTSCFDRMLTMNKFVLWQARNMNSHINERYLYRTCARTVRKSH